MSDVYPYIIPTVIDGEDVMVIVNVNESPLRITVPGAKSIVVLSRIGTSPDTDSHTFADGKEYADTVMECTPEAVACWQQLEEERTS